MGGHTPGPWHRDWAGMGNVWSKDCKIADVANPKQDVSYRDVPDAERGANARLIAAAPDLLAALEEVIRPYGIYDCFISEQHANPRISEFVATGQKIRAALLKAKDQP